MAKFYVREDMVADVHCEAYDGSQVLSVFYIVGEEDTGRRYRHNHTFSDGDEAQEFCDKVTEASRICMAFWSAIAPAYGSAYHAHVGDRPFADKEEAENIKWSPNTVSQGTGEWSPNTVSRG